MINRYFPLRYIEMSSNKIQGLVKYRVRQYFRNNTRIFHHSFPLYGSLDSSYSLTMLEVEMKNIYHIRRVLKDSLKPEYFKKHQKISLEEREKIFKKDKIEIAPYDTIILAPEENLPIEKKYFQKLEGNTGECPIWRYETETRKPSCAENKAFYSHRAGGKYEIDQEAEQILLDMKTCIYSFMKYFANKHNISISFLGSSDLDFESPLGFQSRLSDKQKEEFFNTIYNKWLIKIKLSAEIAKQNLIKKSKTTIITKNIIEDIKKT